MEKTALKLLQQIYRDPMIPLHTRIRAAVEALPFELSAIGMAHLTSDDFASALERAIQRSAAGKPIKLIEVQAIEVEDK
jgi:hypothetical protein